MRPLIHRLSALTKSIPLRLILVVPFVLQIAFAIGLVGGLSIQNGYQAVNEVAGQFRHETSDHIQQYLKTYIATPHIINQLNADMLHLKHFNLQNLPSLEHYLWHQIQSFDSINEIKFGTEQGGFVAIERLENGSFVSKMASQATGSVYRVHTLNQEGEHTQLVDQRPNYDPRRRPWYKGAAESGKATLIDVYQRFSTPKPVIDAISASLPLYDEQQNFIGIASVDLALSEMSEFLQQLRIGRSSKTFIVDRSGLLIGSSSKQKRSDQNLQQTKAIDSQDALIRFAARSLLDHFGNWAQMTTRQQLDFALNGDRQFVQVTPLQDDKGLDWRIVLVVPEADFMDRINASTQTTVLLCIAAFAAATGLGVYTARGITTPIFRLSRAAEAIAQGDLDQTVRVRKGANEITVLAQSFNQMAQQLRDSFNQLASANEALELRVQQRTAELQASEAKFAAAFRSSPYPIGISTLVDGCFVEVNDACCQVFGSSREAIIGRTSQEIGIYQHLSDRARIVQRLQDTGSVRNLELEICTPSNQFMTIRCSVELIDLNGEACILWVWEDITERKRAEEALRTSEAKFAAAFRSSPYPVGIATLAEGRFVEVNDALCQALDYSREALIGRTSIEIGFYQNPADRAKVLQMLEEAGSFRNLELEICTRLGNPITMRCSVERIDLNGEACVLMVWEDITERKRAEEALQQSEAKYRGLFENSQVGIFRTRISDGLFLDVNQRFAEMMGYSSPTEIIGIKRSTDFQSLDDRARTTAILQANSEFNEFEIPFRKRDGSIRWGLLSARLNATGQTEGVVSDISDRKSAEAALQASEAKFAAAFHASPYPISISTLEQGRFIEVNESFCEVSGYQPEEIIGRTGLELQLWKPEDRVKIVQSLQENKLIRNQETEFQIKSGKNRTVLLSAQLINLNGQPCILWVAVDITERKRIEAALQRSEEKYRNIFESSQVGIFRSRSEDGIYVDANQRFAEMLGYRSPADIIGIKQSSEHYANLNDRAKVLEVLRTNSEFHDFEIQLRRVDGSVFWALASARYADANHNEGVMIDISDRVRVEEEREAAKAALQSQLHFLQVLIDAIPTPIFYKDAQGVLLGCNQAYEALTGLTKAQIIGRSAEQLFPPDLAKLYTEEDQTVLQSKGAHLYENSMAHTNGSRRAVISYKAAFLNSDGSLGGLVGTMTDITDRKAAEVALKAAMEAAEVANRAKSQFLSHMSHEFRTPLNAILGFTQLMQRNGEFTATQQDYLETINRSGEHLLTLINNVLELSKIEAGKMTLQETTCDLNELLNWLHQIFELQATSKGLQLVFDRIDLPHYIQTDEGKLRQVLMNLLGNAIKFTRTGSVTLHVAAQWNQEIEHEALHQPLTLSFAVEDTGAGIAPTELQVLFEPFVQTETGRNSQEGTGLGLPISRKFIRLMGGELFVESQVGKGTIFKFEIPVVAVIVNESDMSVSRQQIIGIAAGQPDYRILVVEDKLENRRVLTDLLTSVGFEVREAANGQAAIALWQAWKPDLIWMDLQMPEMDGLQATQQIKAASTDGAPVIIAVTGNAFEEDRIAALSTGCDDFVRKPIQTKIILDKMVEHLGVRYRYAEVAESKLNLDHDLLTRADFATMPMEWVEQLHQAASNVSAKQILKLVEQIPPSQATLADAIAQLVRNFQFESLIELTQPLDLS